MSINQTPNGKWKAQCKWKGASYYIGLFGSRDAAHAAVEREYEMLDAGTSIHILGTATLSLKDYAARIQVRHGTVKRWATEGLPCARAGNVVRVDPDAADAWVRQHHAASVSFARQGLVYVAQRDSDDAVKVGWTSNIEQRLRDLRKEAGAAVCLVGALPGDKPRELRIHKALEGHRIEGEWYACVPEAALTLLRSA